MSEEMLVSIIVLQLSTDRWSASLPLPNAMVALPQAVTLLRGELSEPGGRGASHRVSMRARMRRPSVFGMSRRSLATDGGGSVEKVAGTGRAGRPDPYMLPKSWSASTTIPVPTAINRMSVATRT